MEGAAGRALRDLPVGRCWLLAGLGLLLLALGPLSSGAAGAAEWPPQGESVTPRWISGRRSRRSVEGAEKAQPPDHGEVAMTVDGKELVLVLERNQLLSPDYTEVHYADDGQPVIVSPDHTELCYFHGYVRGHVDSWVVLSTCSGFSGLIVLDHNVSYYLKPPANTTSEAHALFRAKDLLVKGGTCQQGDSLPNSVADVTGIFHPLKRKKRDSWKALKYMELFIVADHSMFRAQKQNLGVTKQRILEIANYVDKFYRSLNIKVALIGLEVWTDQDKCMVSEDSHATLVSFLQWKKTLRARKKHDNAQLLTGITFRGTTIGMAPLEGMCSVENSGGVSMDHSELPIGAAATMAHEIGHNFGMSHDAEGCCVEATASQGGCVMAAATGHPFPRVFSSCSRSQLESYFQKGGGVCLFNLPDTKDLVVGKKCGNGFLEEGEECDCGEAEECTNLCCNPQNCTLKAGAECAHGECCNSCKLKTAGIMCREPAGTCDLPEYCTGASPYCPANVYLLDGSTCSQGEEYCYNGMCMTHHQQCIQLWGRGAWPAPDACFQDVNRAGDMYGNCGKDRHGNYVKCAKRDAKCGKIQCQSPAAKPKGTNTISMDTTIRFNGQEIKCRGTLVYATKDDEGDLSDPGLVMTGTKCGDGLVCKDQRCLNASFFDLDKCISKCHGHGVCNSNQNCHCNAGWAPPFCEKRGLGGSVDSGPVQQDHYEAILTALVVVFLLVMLCLLLGLYACYRRQNSLLHKWAKGFRKRTKTWRNGIVHQKTSHGHSNSAFILQDISSANKVTSSVTSKRWYIQPVRTSSGELIAKILSSSENRPIPPLTGPANPISSLSPIESQLISWDFFGCPAQENGAGKQVARGISSLKPNPPQKGPHPINVVRPLRPGCGPSAPLQRDLKPSRPPPFHGSPAMPPKSRFGGPTKLPPPKKPLPSTPIRPPPVNPQPRPPYKPLPKTLLAKDVASSPSSPLLVMVPPTSCKPAGIGASNHLSKPLKPVAPQRPLPGLKVQPASFAFKK